MSTWTQQMAMHLNGGSKFSQLNFNLFCDGKETGIVRITRTSGSPKYLKTIDTLIAPNKDEFDVLATRGNGMQQWLEAHRPAAIPPNSVAQADVEPPDVGGAIKE